ncbi:mucin-2 isoform X2 [Drosophila virilis]|uniref:mucin-2 isoform X2 n=1 Tax=Drosophila virilis TaxID=7244 RepID=UPI0038B2A32F
MRNTNSNMQFSTHRRSLYWLLGLCLLLFETGLTNAQSKRTPRVTNSRSFSTNVKSTSSNGVSFDCPEEFGYYPHPTDCTQYYVCVFGGALLESCTGGLMYSHELQTCDWPRNVGCELVDSGTSATSTEVGNASRNKPQQHVPSRIRFGAAFTSPAATQKTITVPPQYHRSPPQIIPAQVQHIPPPPELAVSPNPVVTSRGQPKSLLDSQEEIAKLYAEAQETLPPVEEEESDRQQRVYRGQPSTVSQVQRDRDGILHQASINAIPNHGKIGSYTFGTAYSESLDDDVIIEHELSHNRLDVYRRRKRRDVSGLMLTTPEETSVPTEIPNDSNTSSEVMESDSANSTQQGSGETTNNSNNSNNSQEQYDEAAPLVSQLQKYSSKISQSEIGFPYTDADYSEHVEDNNDTVTGESKRRARQLRPFPHAAVKWPAHGYRSVDPPFQQPYIQKNSYSFGSFNPYLTPPSQQAHTNQNYNKLNPGPGYKAYPQQPQQQEPVAPYGKKPTLVYTGYNLSLPPPPLEDDFRPIAGNYYGAASSTSSRPPGGYQEETSQADLLPYLIQQLKELKERRKQIQTENFAYFHLDNQPIAPTTHSTTPRPSFEYFSTTKSTPQVTPNSHNAQYSTMGGFYNNNPDYVPSTSNYSGKLISQYSITQSPEPQSTTESNYFQYNIIANQKMKGVYNTAKLNQIDHAAVKVRPPVTPLQVTPNFNIVSAPNLAYNKPNDLQLIPFRDLSHLPVGISYASNTTIPESYQTFTKSISSTVPPKLDSHKPPTTAKPQMTNFQFNINEFMANLKASDLASFNPAVNPLIKYFKQVSNDGSGNIRNALILRRPVSSSTPTSTITTRAPFKSNSTPTKASISSTTQASTTPSLKGYKVFVKNTQNQINKHIPEPNQSTTTSTPRSRNSGSRTTTTQRTVEYYDEDYDDGVDEDMLPPSRMPPYMPMSETMAPPRPQVTTNVPPTTRASKIRPSVQTGFMEATTTRRPFPNFLQFNQPNAGIGVPAFISFPSDIFQELKQRLPQLQGSTDVNTQSTLRVRITNTTSTTTPTTLTTPTRIRYTVRPQRVRGQQKWQVQAVNNPDGLQRKQNETGRGAAYAKPGSSNDGLGGQHLNSIHISSNTERQRDIEYQQQQEQHQQKSQPYQSTVRQQQQSTYRPLEILTTPTPPQRPSYSSQPTLSYNTDYDEDLNAQIEQDNVYDQPTRTPQRAEAMTIQALDTRTTASTTERSAARPDGRNYYDTFTTPITNYEETDYSYSSSAEYAQNLPADYYQSEQTLVKTRPSTQAPKSKNTDDYYLIANDVAHSTSAFKVDPTKKYTTMTPTRPPISKSSSVPIRNTNKIATTTTQTVTKPPETTTTTKTTTLNPSSSKAHANKNFKQNVIIKLKTTTSPRTTQAPSTKSPTTSTIKKPSLPTYDSNPFLKSKLQFLAKSLISAVAGSQSQNINDTRTPTQVQSTVTPPFSESWALANDSANSSSTQKYVETIYDETQNVQNVQGEEISSGRNFDTITSPKFLDFINAAAYGASNLVRAPTEKSFKTLYTRENIYNGLEKDKAISTEQNQSKRIQSYVLSDVKPQSFRPTINNSSRAASSDLLDSSSTARPNKAYEYSLESGSHGFTLKAKESLNEENVSEPLFERPESGQRLKPSTTTTTTRLPHTLVNHVSTENEDIIPTTYAPLRIWRNGRPTIKQTHRKPTKMPLLSVTDLSSTTAKATTTTIKAPNTFSSSTERASSGQSFTSRANIFKDNLNRATSNPGMRFVSPYKSLESLLQDERMPHNSLRTTTRTRYANAPASIPFLQTTPKSTHNSFPTNIIQNNATQIVLETMTNGNMRNFSISDVILSTFSPQRPSLPRATTTTTAKTTTTNKIPTEAALTTTILEPTVATVVTSPSIQVSEIAVRARGRSRYTAATISYNLDSVDEPTTYAPKFKIPNSYELRSSTSKPLLRRKAHRGRAATSLRQTISEPTARSGEKYETYKAAQKAKETVYRYQIAPSSAKPITAEDTSSLKRNPNENEALISDTPRAEALIAQQPLENKHNNSIEQSISTETSASSIQDVHIITDRPPVKYLYSNKYRQKTAERTLADSLQNAGYITTANGRTKFRATNVLEQLQHFLSASDSDESGSSQFVDEVYGSEIKASVNEITPGFSTNRSAMTTMRSTTAMSASLPTTRVPLFAFKSTGNPSKSYTPTPTISIIETDATKANISIPDISTEPVPSTTTATPSVTISSPPTTRVSRVNNALKSSIAAAAAQSSSPVSTSSTYQMPGGRANKFQYGLASNSNNNQHQYNNNNAAVAAVSVKCSDSTLSPKCNEIPSRNNNRNRGSSIFTNQDRDTAATPNRGTHPPRTRPTLKPAGTIVSKAQEFVDIYRYPPSRPDPLYPQPTPDKTAAKCRKDVCLLPDCYCGGKDIPGELPVESIPQIVLLTFDDSVNDLNKQLYTDLFEKGRVNPNGCPITATFYVSHEWTDYSQVQNLYADGHEMASHTVSHSFGEQFSQKKWTREIAGQREILAAYGGVKLSDVRGMRAPFLSVGGNKMYKMLYDSNFTYDSSMPVYENRPPSWPYTLDYKIFHDCMIPPCPTRSYPGVWQVPMVMWQDLNGGRCSMGDACSNPSDSEGVTKMIMKNFERHYTTNRAPFGLFYHAAWFTQPHHKEGFIKFLDAINAMQDVWIITNWQALQWVRDPTPTSRINSFQPFQCDYSDRPKRCNNPKVCNLWHKSGVRYMKTCQPCPDIYPWTGKSGIRSSRIDNEVEEPSAQN